MRILSSVVLVSVTACGAVKHEQPDASAAPDGAGALVDGAPGAIDAPGGATDAPVAVGGCAVAPTIAGTGAITSWTRLTGNVNVDYAGNGVHAVDVTRFADVWHTWLSSSDPVPWPGGYGAIATIPVPTNRYVSAELTVPSPYFGSANAPANLYGKYMIGESNASARISMTISTHCGDFGQLQPTTIVPGCVLNDAGADAFVAWRNQGSCLLEDGKTYYLNIINADVSPLATGGAATSTANAKCAGGSCTDPISNGPGSWQGYTP